MEDAAFFVYLGLAILITTIGCIAIMVKLSVYERLGMNSDERATECFKQLVDAASQELIVYDDGDQQDFYNDEELIEVVLDRLNENENLRVKCCFNEKSDLKWHTKLAHHERVEIKIRSSKTSGPPKNRHMKIIDGGRAAYLSVHDVGEDMRKFKLMDLRFLLLPSIFFKLIVNRKLGSYLRDFEILFEEADPIEVH